MAAMRELMHRLRLTVNEHKTRHWMRANRTSGLMSGMWKRSMAEMLGHSQTKGRAIGNPNLSLHHRATSRLYPGYKDVMIADAPKLGRGTSRKLVAGLARDLDTQQYRSRVEPAPYASAATRSPPFQVTKTGIATAADHFPGPGSGAATCADQVWGPKPAGSLCPPSSRPSTSRHSVGGRLLEARTGWAPLPIISEALALERQALPTIFQALEWHGQALPTVF